MTELFGCS